MMRRRLIVVVIGLTFLLALAFWYQSQKPQSQFHQQFLSAAKVGKDPESVVRAFLWALSIGDFNLAHEFLDKSSRKKVTPNQLASLSRFFQISRILAVRVRTTNSDRALSDFTLVLKGLDAPIAEFIREYVTVKPKRQAIGGRSLRIPVLRDLWRMFRAYMFPTRFDTAPKGWLLQLGSDGKTNYVDAVDASYQGKRKPPYPFSLRPYFFLRRYELVREDGKWRISNAVGP